MMGVEVGGGGGRYNMQIVLVQLTLMWLFVDCK